MKKLSFIIVFLLINLFTSKISAQELRIDLDLRPRFEYRHGFHNLFPSGAEPAAFIQQRSRLKFGYHKDKFKAHFSFQDVSVWGDTRQILPIDGNDSFQIADAWVSFDFHEHWSTKVGRQVFSYDDQRILGGLDWAMQGRFHDAALLSYKKGKSKLDLAFSFSQNSGAGNPGNEVGNVYDVTGFFSYKALEMAHYHIKATDDVKVSLLFMNTTFQNLVGGLPAEGFNHSQTFGTHTKFKLGGINFALNGFLQTGERQSGANPEPVSLSAYLTGLEGMGKIGKTKLGLGFELQSGTDQGSTDDENNSFFPLYGTNHKFNGLMDYFYVGNHANSVGLLDVYAKMVFKTGKTSSLMVAGHYFEAAADLLDPADGSNADAYLGTEVDLVYSQKVLPFATLKIGYSHMFAGDSMEILKNQVGTASGVQNWGWAMLVVKPNLLKFKTETVE